MGIFFSFLAMCAWGVGDFLIQRSARKFGNWVALFYITVFASVILLPFVYRDLGILFAGGKGLGVLLLASVTMTIASVFIFEALRIGKLSVLEPILAFELVVTVLWSSFLLKEHLNLFQIVLIAIVCLCYLGYSSQVALIAEDWKRHKKLIVSMSFIDNFAWIAFSYGTLYVPIAIVTSISEAYVALAALLGLTYNREHLRSHQIAGLVVTVIAAIVLSGIS